MYTENSEYSEYSDISEYSNNTRDLTARLFLRHGRVPVGFGEVKVIHLHRFQASGVGYVGVRYLFHCFSVLSMAGIMALIPNSTAT